MATHCQQAKRLWHILLEEKKLYTEAMEKEFRAIREWDLEFPQFEKEILRARRRYGIAKIAVTNHHRVHRCAECSQETAASSAGAE